MPAALANVTVAVEPATLTEYVMPLVAVVPVAPLARLKVVPSAVRTSEAPLLTLPTVSWRLVMVWPASIVEAAAPANRDTDEPSSVKVGFDPLALNVGASFTAVTLTVEATVLEPVVPSLMVKLTVREAVEGLSELLAYCPARSAACHCASVAVPPAEVSVITPVAALYDPAMLPIVAGTLVKLRTSSDEANPPVIDTVPEASAALSTSATVIDVFTAAAAAFSV